MKKIIILTGNELRHQYFKKKLSLDNRFSIITTYCEAAENIIDKAAAEQTTTKRTEHILARQQSEIDFFEEFINATQDKSNSLFMERGDINNEENIQRIVSANPDLIVVYGASILHQNLLSHFPKKILNVHLGLSPYYRGVATNFWPLVHNLPECVGATFMYVDAGIDTGEIIHQLRAEYEDYDTPSAIGNRLIRNMTTVYSNLIYNLDCITSTTPPVFNVYRKLCKKNDFNELAVEGLYANFKDGIIENYLRNKKSRNRLFPIVENEVLL